MPGARSGVVLTLLGALGCGRSIQGDTEEGFGGSSGESSGGTGRGGSSGSSGSPVGGSAQGGASQGGSGAGGAIDVSARLLLQENGSLLATDLDGAESIELCPAVNGLAQYTLIDWVDERAIVLRQNTNSPIGPELLRVALDGSECAAFFSGTITRVLSPVIGGRVVITVPPALVSEFDPDDPDDPDPPNAIEIAPSGLASVALDGTDYEILAPTGVTGVWIAGDRVLFMMTAPPNEPELYTALPDGSVIEPLMTGPGSKSVSFTSGSRVVVSVSGIDVYAVDADGSRAVPLAVAPEVERAARIVGDEVIIERGTSVSVFTDPNLFRVGLGGGELVPITTTAGGEFFVAATPEHVIYNRATGGLATDLYSVSLDGGDPVRITKTPDAVESFLGFAGNRVVFESHIPLPDTEYRPSFVSARIDGIDTVTLRDDATDVATLVGERVVLYVNWPSYDVVSVDAAGGDDVVLADGAGDDWVVGRLGRVLLIQQGPWDGEAEIIRTNADGSNAVPIAASARYVGAVTEACGAVPGSPYELSNCAD